MKSVNIDLVAHRHAVFGAADGEGTFELLGVDWHAATFDMAIRPTPGTVATALIALGMASPGSDGISASYDAGLVNPLTGVVVGGTTVIIQINESTLEALAWPADPAQPLVLAYDLRVLLDSGPRRVVAYGAFTVYPGVTY